MTHLDPKLTGTTASHRSAPSTTSGLEASAPTSFRVAAGSVIGREHVRSGKNNHDAFAWVQRGSRLAAVVADGCGSGKHSELGARLGARTLTTLLSQDFDSPDDPQTILDRARRGLLDELRHLATLLGATDPHLSGPDRAALITDHMLFTLVGALVLRNELVTFSLGDGVLVVNGQRTDLGPFPGNRPPYLAYEMLGLAGDFSFTVHHRKPADTVSSVLLGTDGVADLADGGHDLSRFWSDPRVFKNADIVRRRLVVADKQSAGSGLPDDTTLLVLSPDPIPAAPLATPS